MPSLSRDTKRRRVEDDKDVLGSKDARLADRDSKQVEDKEYVVPPPGRLQPQQQQQQQQQQQEQQPSVPADNTIWEQKAPVEEAANLEEELDSYFDGMFA